MGKGKRSCGAGFEDPSRATRAPSPDNACARDSATTQLPPWPRLPYKRKPSASACDDHRRSSQPETLMAGHSQFKNIMHRKGKQDAVRAKLFAKLAREITGAAKIGQPG